MISVFLTPWVLKGVIRPQTALILVCRVLLSMGRPTVLGRRLLVNLVGECMLTTLLNFVVVRLFSVVGWNVAGN